MLSCLCVSALSLTSHCDCALWAMTRLSVVCGDWCNDNVYSITCVVYVRAHFHVTVSSVCCICYALCAKGETA